MTDDEIPTLSEGARHAEALPTAVRWSHALLKPRLRPGDLVVDATMGNGHDTEFLAQCVLPGGHVFAFDVQEEALIQTRKRLERAGLLQTPPSAGEPVTLFHAGHEQFEAHLPTKARVRIRAFMFNLGWLPGAESKATITRSETTLAALHLASEWLMEGGLITVVCYPGHAGGDTEAQLVESWAAALAAEHFEVQKLAFLNLTGAPPRCIVIRKRTRLSDRTRG